MAMRGFRQGDEFIRSGRGWVAVADGLGNVRSLGLGIVFGENLRSPRTRLRRFSVGPYALRLVALHATPGARLAQW